MPETPVISCTPKALPPDVLQLAARLAWEHNPANYPMIGHIALVAPGVDMPQAIALLTTKYWGAKERKLPTKFLDGGPAELRSRILAYLNRWSCGITFAETKGTATIRITRGQPGYWSFLGTDNAMIPIDQPTMCLQEFSLKTPESEWKRVIPHEGGHALGFPHEHLRKDLVSRLDPQRTRAFFFRMSGWPREMTDAQVLTPLDERTLLGTPADEMSAMAYQIPGDCTKDGKPIVGGTDVNKTDRAFAQRIYPKAKVPKAAG